MIRLAVQNDLFRKHIEPGYAITEAATGNTGLG
jgi:cysteine synthase